MGLVRPNDTLPSSHFLCRSSVGLQVLEAVNRADLVCSLWFEGGEVNTPLCTCVWYCPPLSPLCCLAFLLGRYPILFSLFAGGLRPWLPSRLTVDLARPCNPTCSGVAHSCQRWANRAALGFYQHTFSVPP